MSNKNNRRGAVASANRTAAEIPEETGLDKMLKEARAMAATLRACYAEEGCSEACPMYAKCDPVGSSKRNATAAAELLEKLAEELRQTMEDGRKAG